MKLALVRRRFAASGGAELYVQRLLGALQGAGHQVHLLAEHWEGIPSGVRLHQLSVNGGRSVRPIRFAAAVEEALKRERFDCVLSLERTSRQDVYRAGDGVHRAWLRRRRQFAPWWRRPLIGWGAFHRNVLALERETFDPSRTSRVIVNSEMVLTEIMNHFGFPRDRLHLVRNGVEVERFRGGDRAATRARFGIAPDERLLLFAGSGWERKGLRFLLPVAGRMAGERVKLLVAGKDSPPRGHPPNVIFAGVLERLEDAYAAADLFTFPPIYDPCANVCLEALAAGLPVITSRQNGAAELIERGVNGTVLSDPSNAAALEDAIRLWLERPKARPVPVTHDLSLERNVAETVQVLQLAVAGRR